jgi:hypothetical protein
MNIFPFVGGVEGEAAARESWREEQHRKRLAEAEAGKVLYNLRIHAYKKHRIYQCASIYEFILQYMCIHTYGY